MSHASLLCAIDCPGGDREEIERLVTEQMQPFQETDTWFGDGTRWDWHVIGGRFADYLAGGDIIQAKNIDQPAMLEKEREDRIDSYEHIKGETNSAIRAFSGIDPDTETVESYLARSLKCVGGLFFPSHYAFLHNYEWNERERMGWFGGEAATECEIAGLGEGRCIHEHKQAGARIISWGVGRDDWSSKFYARFVKNLPPDIWLVTVDYHV